MLDAALGVPTGTVQPSSTAQVVQLAGSDKIMAEYIWLGGSGADLKSRTVVLDERPGRPEDLPIAEIDGSSYGQAPAESCEVYLQPKKIFPDPFRGGDHILVLCDTYVPPLACTAGLDPWEHMQPHASNHRPTCEAAMQHAAFSEPVFTMQQEYCVLGDASAPKPFSSGGSFAAAFGGGGGGGAAPVPIKPSAGLSEKAAARLGREVAELHMQACLGAGLAYDGCHASGPAWAYKIGPCAGVDAADQLCLSRFLLGRIAEHSEACIAYDGLTSGAPAAAANKCVVHFSTAASRDPHAGLSSVQDMMERLHSASHAHALLGLGALAAGAPGCPPVARSGSWHSASGAFNGIGAASSGSGHGVAAPLPHGPPAFTIGIGNKAAAIMVPTSTLLNKCGPILDQRPPGSADPYLTTMLLLCGALGTPLPAATLSSMQLAAEATLLRAAGPCANRSAGSCRSYGSASLSASPSCSYSGDDMCGSADSAEVLLSALDRLDGFGGGSGGQCARRPAGSGLCSCAASSGSDEALSDACSDASSPPLMGCHGLAAAVGVGDQEMFYE